MTTIDPAGYSEAGAHLFTWLADKALGGVKKAFGWGWERAQWAAAQDRYDARIIKDYGQIRIFGQTTPKSLKDIFTDVYVLDTPTAYRRFDPAALTEQLWNEDRGLSFRHEERRPGEQLLNEGSKFFLQGKPGAGKTTFLKHLAVREAQRGHWGLCLGKIPIFVSLKQFAETNQPLFDFIVNEFAICRFPDAAPFVDRLLKSGQALVLFDGLDEVSKTEEDDRRGRVTQMLADFARHYDACHIVITCRIAAVEYTFEPTFTYLEMADFAPDQVEAFVRAWFWDESEKGQGVVLAEGMLAESAKPEHAGIRDLGRNPLLLTLLCLNYAETHRFPARRVEIYEEALDALLKKWDTSRRIQRGGLYKTLSLGRKRQMFARIAFDTMVHGEIIFPRASLEHWLVEYLVNVPELPSTIDIDGEAVLQEIVAQHGIFTEQAHGLFSFAHLTFQEYYSARYIAENAALGGLDTLLDHFSDGKWREVILLTVSLLPDSTALLARFETHLHKVMAARPRLAAWLNWVDTHVSLIQPAYKRPAVRILFGFELVQVHSREVAPYPHRNYDSGPAAGSLRELDPNLVMALFDAIDLDPDLMAHLLIGRILNRRLVDIDFAGDIDRATARALDVAVNLDHTLAFEVDLVVDLFLLLGMALPIGLDRERDFDRILERIRNLCRLNNRADLLAATNALVIPEASTSHETWACYVIELGQVMQAYGVLARFQQMQTGLIALREEQRVYWSFENADIETLTVYAEATQLFYDCLQVAYTPDRRSFEERIFWLPPNRN